MRDLKLLRYNWKILYKKTQGDCKQILSVVKALVGLKKPSQKDKKTITEMVKGNLDGWILQPKMLLMHRGSTDWEKCIYIELASLRSYEDYVQYGIDTIPLFITDYKVDTNCLLEIKEDKIYFKY